MNKTLLYAGAATAGALWLLSQQKPTSGNGAPVMNPGGGLPDQGGGSTQFIGFRAAPELPPDGQRWTGEQWRQRAQYLIEVEGFGAGLHSLWDEWKNSPTAQYIKLRNPESLLLLLGNPPPAVPTIGGFNIQWNSQPQFDTWYNWFWGIPVWQCSHWQQWHVALKAHYGAAQAKTIWINNWNDPDNAHSGSLASWCRYDCTFVNYFKNNDIPLGNMVSNSLCNISTGVQSATSGLATAGKIIGYALPIALIGWLGIEAYQYYQKQEFE